MKLPDNSAATFTPAGEWKASREQEWRKWLQGHKGPRPAITYRWFRRHLHMIQHRSIKRVSAHG